VNRPSTNPVPALKDEEQQHPVASAWRPALREIVKALATGDHTALLGSTAVAPVGAAVADQIREYVADYGETLVELPDDAWTTSVSQWMGTHWDVLVDLWTAESGASDLVLFVRVHEAEEGFRVHVDSVHVP
jgi:hypothetical protein